MCVGECVPPHAHLFYGLLSPWLRSNSFYCYKVYMEKSYTIGFLSSSTQDSYEQALYSGICETARIAGAHVICFTSGALRAYRSFEFQRNVLFDLVTPQNVDGLIISGTLAHPITKEEIQSFFQRFEKIPSVSIALSMPDIPCVMVDSRQGIREIVEHLIKTHHYTRLAYIGGPRGHQEAEDRFQAFAETLAEYGIPLDENLIVQGDYTFYSGGEAMKELLQRPNASFQAVVSANDSMALGAMKVFRASGGRIPEDAAFTGFDDTLEGRFDLCPLTSVRQNIYAQGLLAAQLLLQRIAGQTTPHHNSSPARLIIRQSCGCPGFSLGKGFSSQSSQANWQEALLASRPLLHQEMITQLIHLPEERVVHWVDDLQDVLLASMGLGDFCEFFRMLETTQRDWFGLGIELSVWNRALVAFFQAIKLHISDQKLLDKLTRTELEIQIRLGITSERLEKELQIELDQREITLREISETLMTTFDLDSVLEVLSSELPRINVQACYLALFEDPQNPAELSRLIFGWYQGMRFALHPGGLVFPSKQLLPSGLVENLASSGWVVEALYSKGDRLGFMLLKVEIRNISISNALRALISGALQGVFLLEQRLKAEEKLVQSQHILEALVAKLEFSNHELESFAYSISHDLRAPLRAVNGYAMMLRETVGESLDEDAHLLLEKIANSGVKMAQLIDGLLEISRIGRRSLNVLEIDLSQLVHSAMDTLGLELYNRQIEWHIEAIPPAWGDPVLIQQVYANLLGNAIKYTGNRAVARIEVGSLHQDGQVVYFVRDNGVGFDMNYASKLFGVFQRLHTEAEFPGIGIGLATVQRIIHRHGGRIWAEAEVGKGATFYFTLGTDKE